MNYDIDYFIRKFEAIPEEKWIEGAQIDQQGNSCALGWCMTDQKRERLIKNGIYSDGVMGSWDGHTTEEGSVLWEHILPLKVALINNGNDPNYTQSTPKQRILAALRDAKQNCNKEV